MMDAEYFIEKARAKRATDTSDIKAEMAVYAACNMSDTEEAKNILRIASVSLEQGVRPPRVVELYLSAALRDISTGGDPAQCLNLRANHRLRNSPEELLDIYCYVRHYSSERNISERAAIKAYAKTIDIGFSAAEKRHQQAKPIVGLLFSLLEKNMRAFESNKSGNQKFGFSQLLTGVSVTPETDDLMKSIIELLGVQKKA